MNKFIFIPNGKKIGLTSIVLSFAFLLKKKQINFGFIKPISFKLKKKLDFDISSKIINFYLNIPIKKSFCFNYMYNLLIKKKKNYLKNFFNYYNNYIKNFNFILIEGFFNINNFCFNLTKKILKIFNPKIILVSFFLKKKEYFNFFKIKKKLLFLKKKIIMFIINNSWFFYKKKNFFDFINKIKDIFLLKIIPFNKKLRNIFFINFIKLFKVKSIFYYKKMNFLIELFCFEMNNFNYSLIRKNNTIIIFSIFRLYFFIKNYYRFLGKKNNIILFIYDIKNKYKFFNYFFFLKKIYIKTLYRFFLVFTNKNKNEIIYLLKKKYSLSLYDLNKIKETCIYFEKYLNKIII